MKPSVLAVILAAALGLLAGIALLIRGFLRAEVSPASENRTSRPIESTLARQPRQPRDDSGGKWTNHDQLAAARPIAASLRTANARRGCCITPLRGGVQL